MVRDGYLLVGGTGGIFGVNFFGEFGNAGSLFRSNDGGATFTDLANTGNLPANIPINEIVVDPLESQRVYIATDSQLFRTDNILAATPVWTDITTATLGITAGTSRIRLAIHRSGAGEALYVGVIDASEQLAAVSFSTDRGASYTRMDLPQGLSATVNITGATNASPIAITVDRSLGLNTGDTVVIRGVGGNTAANGSFTVTATSATTFTLDGTTGNGTYTSGGVAQSVFGTNPGMQASLHFSFAADPTNPNLIYAGGDSQDGPFPNGTGATGPAGNSFRGNRSISAGGGAPSAQWTPLVNNFARDGGFHHADSRNITFDATGSLIQVDDGGIYRRLSPQDTGGAWESVVGNLTLNQFYTARLDIRNNVIFGGTQDTSSIQQTSGAGLTGDPIFENTLGGDGFWQAVDNISDPNVTYRYQAANFLATTRRFGYDNNNMLVSDQPVLFADPATPNVAYSALTAGEQFSFGTNIYVINNVDGRLLMVGPSQVNSLFEDADPAGLAGDTITDITPTGFNGTASAIVYGGRQDGRDIPQIAYVATFSGDTNGELFVRGETGGFTELTVPGMGNFFDVEVDPDDWRSVYVLRGSGLALGGDQIYFSQDAGQTWVDLSENLVGTTLNPDGTVADGLSTLIMSLQVFDTNPGSTDGEEYLLASGRGGVFRRVPSIQKPGDAGPWSRYGASLPNSLVQDIQLYNNDRLIAATFGRGAFVLPNVGASIATDTIVIVTGDDNANFMTMTPDPDVAGNVIVTDGLGNSLSFAAAGVFSVQFQGLGGADTVLFTANGQAGGDFTRFTFPTTVDLGGDVGDSFVLNDFGRPDSVQVSVTNNTVGAGMGDNFFASKVTSGVTYTGLQQGTLVVDLSPSAPGGHQFKAASTNAVSTILMGSDGNDVYTLGGTNGLDLIGNLTIEARGGAGDVLILDDRTSKLGNPNVNISATSISGMAGPTNAAAINLAGIDNLTIFGADNSLAESYTIDGLAVPLTLSTFAGNDTVSVTNLQNSATINTGANNDTIRVVGNLSALAGKITIEGGSGDNKLLIDNSPSPTGANFTITSNSISRGNANADLVLRNERPILRCGIERRSPD